MVGRATFAGETVMKFSRRETMLGAAALPLLAEPATAAALTDEDGWARIAASYDVTDQVIQLENGNWGMMARPVLAAYHAALDRVNRESSYYARRGMWADVMAVHDRVTQALGVGRDELVFTRNATEALKGLIGGYNRLRPGDRILIADLDYDSTRSGMMALRDRRGVEVIDIALPEPATYQGLIDAYEQAFRANPRLRLMLLTHVSHRTGLLLPVREIVAMARARGIDVIVDAAHSWGQIDFTVPDIGADFVAVNLHKWIGAPLGVGAMIVKRDRLADIDADLMNDRDESASIAAKVHTGTVDYAALLTVPAALDFAASVGAPAREARLRALRDRWTVPARGIEGVEVLTPADPRLHAGITAFRLRGRTSAEDNVAVAKALLDEHRIFTVHRAGIAKGAAVRVTPALFNRMDQMDALTEALKVLAPKMARKG